MGYSHYWRRVPELDAGAFAAAAMDCGTIAAKIPIRLAGSDGKGAPEFLPELVAFNGPEDCGHPDQGYGLTWPAPGASGVVAHGFEDARAGSWCAGATIKARACNGDCSYESFILEPKVAPRGRAPMAWECVKTAFRPYDLAVQACLIVFACRFPGRFLVTSDGEADLWTEAAEFVHGILGYGREFRLATKAETDAADREPPPPPAPPSRYITAKEAAEEVRAAYKRHGWGPRAISVRSEHYSGGSSLSITIKDPAIPLKLAQDIAKGRENIRRDQWGEILSGGNRYVSIRETPEREAALSSRHLAAVEAAIAELKARGESNIHASIAGTDSTLGYGQHGQEWQLWIGGRMSLRIWHHPAAAASIALRIAHADPDQGDRDLL